MTHLAGSGGRPCARAVLSAAIALLLVILGVAGLMPAPARAEGGPTQITQGSLTWGFKESFRLYVGGATGITAAGGAAVDHEGVATFPLSSGSFDSAAGATDLQFGGSVHYLAHCEAGLGLPPGECALDMLFEQMHLVINGDEQTLYAHVVSRELKDGYPKVDFGVIPIANLGTADAVVTTNGGTTRWSNVSETATLQDVDATTYPAGTPLDPLSFSYQGPGGKPDLGERWTAPGTVALARSQTFTSPTPQNGPLSLYVDSGNGLVDVGNAATSFDTAMPAISPLSADQLAPTGSGTTDLASKAFGAGGYGFDPATGTVFSALTTAANDGSFAIVAATWDPARGGYRQVQVDDDVYLLALTWDAPLNSLVGITYDPDTGVIQLSRWTRAVGAPQGTGWDRTDLAVPDAPAGFDPFGYYAPSGYNEPPLAALSDGSLVLTRDSQFGAVSDANPAPLHLVVNGSVVSVEEIAGATTAHGADAPREAAWVVAGPDGRFVLGFSGAGAEESFVRFGQVEDGTLSMDAERTVIPTPSVEPLVAAFDPTDGTAWVKGFRSGTLVGLRDDRVVASQVFPETAQSYTLAVGADHAVYSGGRTQDVHATVVKLAPLGVSPTILAQPSPAMIGLAGGDVSAPVSFTAAAAGSPEPSVQWQSRALGAARFTDIAGATSETVQLTASATDNGTQYRAVFTNAAGALASDAVAVTVNTMPVVVTQPTGVSVTAGSDAVFLVSTAGSPSPSVTWQRRVDGYWQPIAADDDNFGISSGAGISTLTVPGTNVEQSGSVFRAKAVNSVGAAYSKDVTLTVKPRATIPSRGLRLSGVRLDWSGSKELQSAPPTGGSNYFSAGASEGDEASYRASAGDVSVYQLDASGRRSLATYASRGSHVTEGGSQLVELTGGKAELNADGSGEVDWTGAFSVNFYGGLVPFTVTDPELKVAADGTGTLVGDLSGYGSSQADPSTRSRLDPVEEVTIATFAGVELDPAGVVTVAPAYARVRVTVPAGQSAQDATGMGWGSWPQSWVDFQFQTGLSSYWYSSGGVADSKKAPSPFTVDFTGAKQAGGGEGGEPLPVASTTGVTLDRGGFAYGRTATATVTVTAGGRPATGAVTLTTSGRSVPAPLQDGTARVRLPAGITPGVHTLTVSYAGVASATAPVATSSARVSFTVTRARPDVSLRLVKKRVGHTRHPRARVTVTLPGGTGVPAVAGQVVIRDGGRIVRTARLAAGGSGLLTVRLPKLRRGAHHLRASIGATDLHTAASSPYRTLRVR